MQLVRTWSTYCDSRPSRADNRCGGLGFWHILTMSMSSGDGLSNAPLTGFSLRPYHPWPKMVFPGTGATGSPLRRGSLSSSHCGTRRDSPGASSPTHVQTIHLALHLKHLLLTPEWATGSHSANTFPNGNISNPPPQSGQAYPLGRKRRTCRAEHGPVLSMAFMSHSSYPTRPTSALGRQAHQHTK